MPDIKRFTNRLVLVAATVDHMRAEIVSPTQLGILLKSEIPHGWPPGEYDEGAQKFFLERLSLGGSDVVGWYGWYALLRRSSQQVGPLFASGGFLGPPSETGEVEIGYSVHPDWRGQGYATEMVGELIKWAFEDKRVRRIVAHTTSRNPASCKVLEHLGFRVSSSIRDPSSIEFELKHDTRRGNHESVV
jgi:RimJ/RimL family protein N-acetyltransferase